MGTSVERTSNVVDIYKLADSYEMPADSIDGMSAEAVHEGVSRAIKRARDGGGADLIGNQNISVQRSLHLRSPEIQDKGRSGRIQTKRRDCAGNGTLSWQKNMPHRQKWMPSIRGWAETVADAVKFAEESPIPNDDEVYKDIYIDKNYPFIKD